MTTASPPPGLPPPLFDLVLRLTPLDVLLFDRALICRYAAPAGDQFLGQPRDELEGRHAAEILPPAADGLRPVLERAANEQVNWRDSRYLFSCEVHGVPTEFCWVIQVEPVQVEGYEGVLVTLTDSNELREAVEERDRLRAELEESRRRAAVRRGALHDLRATLRSLLAPISGYLQVIARRPHALAGRPPAAVIADHVLPQMGGLVAAADRLKDIADDDRG